MRLLSTSHVTLDLPHDSWTYAMPFKILTWILSLHMTHLSTCDFTYSTYDSWNSTHYILSFWKCIVTLHIMWKDSLTHMKLWWHLYKSWLGKIWLGSSWWCVSAKIFFFLLPWYLRDWYCMCFIFIFQGLIDMESSCDPGILSFVVSYCPFIFFLDDLFMVPTSQVSSSIVSFSSSLSIILSCQDIVPASEIHSWHDDSILKIS